jgi:transposase
MVLAERVFRCHACELITDRDRNAAAHLAAWADHAQAPDRQAGGRIINASGGEGTGRRLGDGETAR